MDGATAFQNIVNTYGTDSGVSLRHSMNNNALTIEGRIFAFEKDGRLIVKLSAERCAALIAAGQAEQYQLGKRVMRQWAAVPAAHMYGWAALTEEAHMFVASTGVMR